MIFRLKIVFGLTSHGKRPGASCSRPPEAWKNLCPLGWSEEQAKANKAKAPTRKSYLFRTGEASRANKSRVNTHRKFTQFQISPVFVTTLRNNYSKKLKVIVKPSKIKT